MKSRLPLLNLSAGFLTIIILGTLLPLKVKAAPSADILVSVSPENPNPNENVNITLKSYVNNLDSVQISWSIDGRNPSSGIGRKSFSLKAPNAGAETNVTAAVSLPDGVVEKKIIIRPAAMVLLFQAKNSYTPPFYKGKALPSPDSLVKVVTLPEVRSGSGLVNPKNMTYFWKEDYNNNQDGSGYGKNSFTYVNDYLEDSNNISVTASTVDQKYSLSASLDIGMTNPKILFYKNDARLGTIWEQALGDSHKITGSEVIEAVPYFISQNSLRTPVLTWDWFINDNLANTVNFRKNLLPIMAQKGTSGTSRIRLEINNKEKLFESASREITVSF